MKSETIQIKINKKSYKAFKNETIISVADRVGIYIPRFCYHSKLSIAANCRMCMVEVEGINKALPACATVVSDNMNICTNSDIAIHAQKGTMEFLLINHPLDCPICDQGGECELQDLAVGYGKSVSRFTENKRVVQDKPIGPLISTDMTRCIHCTRCVRFGEEIAGVRELGTLGRGEFMEIGTYVEHSIASELSGNVIDLCPVGALNARPSRMNNRSWEMVQFSNISPHDCAGSNLYLHVLRNKIMRVVPKENEEINEVWISDRDRFSYEGLYHGDRVGTPILKKDGKWETITWDEALNIAHQKLAAAKPSDIAALIHPNSTLEELYLFQKLLRRLDVNNIDHRLRQTDFENQDKAPYYPSIPISLDAFQDLDNVVLIGSNVRKDQPIIAHNIRKSCSKGANVFSLSCYNYDLNFNNQSSAIVKPSELVSELASLVSRVYKRNKLKFPSSISNELKAFIQENSKSTSKINISQLSGKKENIVLLGVFALHHPQSSLLYALANLLAEGINGSIGYLPEGSNTPGAWITGCVPHRLSNGKFLKESGKNTNEMFENSMSLYVLFNIEPSNDLDNPMLAKQRLTQANFTIGFNTFCKDEDKNLFDLLIPLAAFSEIDGSYINITGVKQSFMKASPAFLDSKSGWRILRKLGSMIDAALFNYTSINDVFDTDLHQDKFKNKFENDYNIKVSTIDTSSNGALFRYGSTSIYQIDALTRRSSSLQKTIDGSKRGLFINKKTANLKKLTEGEVILKQQGVNKKLSLHLDDSVPDDCVYIPTGFDSLSEIGSAYDIVELENA
jgi:NADH-quinone oxidoreductase subunit G